MNAPDPYRILSLLGVGTALVLTLIASDTTGFALAVLGLVFVGSRKW